MVKRICIVGFCLFLTGLFAQPADTASKTTSVVKWRFKDGFKVYLTADSSKYLKATIVLQTWFRYNSNNPGSTVYGYAQKESFDIGIRRLRFQLFGPVAPRVFVYTQFGLNSTNHLSARKSGAFFHDMVTEFEVVKKCLSLGGGLNGWTGPGRFSTPAVSSTMMADAPIFQQTTNDAIDQFVRKMGVYAKGKLGKLDYRLALSKPFPVQTAQVSNDTALSTSATFSPLLPQWQYQGYLSWQFLEQESNMVPYNTGSYFGKKKVFNLGAGFVYQDKAVRYLKQAVPAAGDTVYAPMALFAVDVFYDAYLSKEKGNALSFYAGYFNYNFGQKFMRYTGVMNTANGNNNAALYGKTGFGSAFPMVATGSTVFTQFGYKFRDGFLKNLGTLMPYAGAQFGQYEALNDNMLMYELGFNWLISGAHKLSLNYQSRPVFERQPDGTLKDIKSARRGMLYLQYQISL